MLEESLFVNAAGGMVVFVMLVSLWTLPWKGVALWKAARAGSRGWFIVFLVVNTVAVLEILYIFVFSKKRGEIIDDANEGPEVNIANKQGTA